MKNLDLGRLRRFGAVHYRAKRDELEEDDLAAYQNERDRLEQELRDSQHDDQAPGQALRRALRIPCELLVHFNLGGRIVKASTLDVSATGLAAEFAAPVEVTGEMNVRLSMPDGEPLFARGRTIYVQKNQNGGQRFGCEFVEISDGESERLKRLVFDNVLDRLAN